MKQSHILNVSDLPKKNAAHTNIWLDLYAQDGYFFMPELPDENFISFKRDNIDRPGWLNNHADFKNKTEAEVIKQLDKLLGEGTGEKLILAYNSEIQSFLPFVLLHAISADAELTIKQPYYNIYFGKDKHTGELLLHVETRNYTVYDLRINHAIPDDITLGRLNSANLLFRLSQRHHQWGFQLLRIETNDEIIAIALKGETVTRDAIIASASSEKISAMDFPPLPGTVLDDYQPLSSKVYTYYGFFTNPYKALDVAYKAYFAARETYQHTPSLSHGENVIDAFIDFNECLTDVIKKTTGSGLINETNRLMKKSVTERDALMLSFKLHLDAFSNQAIAFRA